MQAIRFGQADTPALADGDSGSELNANSLRHVLDYQPRAVAQNGLCIEAFKGAGQGHFYSSRSVR